MQKNIDHSHRYDDIIDLPRPVSKIHPPMPVSDRAAQFSPFAALTGHEAAIRETARLTDRKIELDENSKEILNEKLLLVISRIKEQPEVTLTYFVPDSKKGGGSYVVKNGRVKKFDDYGGVLILTDGTNILFDDVIDLDGNLFHDRFLFT